MTKCMAWQGSQAGSHLQVGHCAVDLMESEAFGFQGAIVIEIVDLPLHLHVHLHEALHLRARKKRGTEES